ncbi:hypothetical protein J3F83DRAFT_430319 [Trichoderma novae-zelandiae]
MAESRSSLPSKETDFTNQKSTMTAGVQPETDAQPSTNHQQTISKPPADQPERDSQDEEYLEGAFSINERRPRFDEKSCTIEEKEISDLFKKGLLDDGSTGPLKGDFTLNNLPPLSGDEACSIQWTAPKKKKQKQNMPTGAGDGIREMGGLSDDELASVLQACPDLDGFITNN